MLRTLEKAAALINIGLKGSLAYKLDYLFSFGFRIVFALLMLFVWSAIYLSSHAGSIGGFSISQMYAYYFLAGMMYLVITTEIDQQLQQDIRSGNVTIAFTRPINYAFQLLINSLSANLLYMLGAIPLLLIATFLSPLSITPVSLGFLALEIAVGYVIVNIMGFMIGSLAVYLTEVWGIMSVTWNLEFLLSGGVLPLTLFPPLAGKILLLLPFQMLLYTPVATLLGVITNAEIVQELIISTIWAAVLFIIAAIMWYRIRRGLTAVGG